MKIRRSEKMRVNLYGLFPTTEPSRYDETYIVKAIKRAPKVTPKQQPVVLKKSPLAVAL